MRGSLLLAAGIVALAGATSYPANAAPRTARPAVPASAQSPASTRDCPSGAVRFAIEPFDAQGQLAPIYTKIGDALAKALDCKVQVSIAAGYNSEIEAMRAGRLEIAEFGPLGYVRAHEVGHADVVAAYAGADGKPSTDTAGIVSWPGSGVTMLKDVAGKSFAYSSPDSLLGHLFPAAALQQIGIDPDKGVAPFFATTHAAAFEALRGHKAAAGELSGAEIAAATKAGTYRASDFVELWRSGPIPGDAIAIRSTLPAGFRARATKILQDFDFAAVLTPEAIRIAGGSHWVAEQDKSYDIIRELVTTLHLDLDHLE